LRITGRLALVVAAAVRSVAMFGSASARRRRLVYQVDLLAWRQGQLTNSEESPVPSVRKLIPAFTCIAFVGTSALVAAPSQAASTAPQVTWTGYRGVTFGESLQAAAKTLHGTVKSGALTSTPNSLIYPGEENTVDVLPSLVWLDDNVGRHQSRASNTVGSFWSIGNREPILYPLGTFDGQSLAKFKRALGAHAHRFEPAVSSETGYYLVGPHGRVIWGYGDSAINAIGLASSLSDAKFQWRIEG
jgi:hypothetical protein